MGKRNFGLVEIERIIEEMNFLKKMDLIDEFNRKWTYGSTYEWEKYQLTLYSRSLNIVIYFNISDFTSEMYVKRIDDFISRDSIYSSLSFDHYIWIIELLKRLKYKFKLMKRVCSNCHNAKKYSSIRYKNLFECKHLAVNPFKEGKVVKYCKNFSPKSLDPLSSINYREVADVLFG